MRYTFMNEDFAMMYDNVKRIGKIFRSFAILAIIVACLGLFGLAEFVTKERTKEIGVRKVLGASAGNVMALLSKELLRWVLLANVFAWPLAYFLMRRWLQDFAFRTQLSIESFIAAGVITVGFAFATICYQTFHAARAKPVDSLRYE